MQELPTVPAPSLKAERQRLPDWIRAKFPGGPNYTRLRDILRGSELHTVCEEAMCPNIGECWEVHRTATFLILGDELLDGFEHGGKMLIVLLFHGLDFPGKIAI